MILNIVKNLRHFDRYYRINNLNLEIKQNGGGNLKFKYKNNIINFKRYVDKYNNIEIFLKTIDKKSNCIVITIDKKNKVGYISSINSKFGDCLKNKSLDNNGITFLKISIKLLKKYQNEFEIDKIELSDDALFYCDIKTKINLSKLNFLQYGESYYGRFGFTPVKIIDIKGYNLNKKIINKIKTKDINLTKILNEYKKEINRNLLIKINKKYIKYSNKKLIIWFNKISRILSENNCDLLSYLVDNLFLELKLYPIDNIFYEIKLKDKQVL